MIYNYLLTSVRSLKRKFAFSIINILGLSIGLAGFLLLQGYTNYEERFDDFHEKSENIFRINFERYKGGELKTKYPVVMPGLGNRLKNHISEVKYMTRYTGTDNKSIIKFQDNIFEQENVFYSDTDFLKMFSFKLISGDVNTVLKNPYSIVLTESIANKIFGTVENVLNQEIIVINDWGNQKLNVTGILEDPPKNTNFNFKSLVSFSTINAGKSWFENSWTWYGFQTFIGVDSASSLINVKKQFPDFISKYKTDPNEIDKEWKFIFQPLKKIRLNSNFSNLGVNQDKKQKTINLLKLVALLVIVISCVNYVNLTTAASSERAREIGVRKALGAYRSQVSIQFIIETIIVNLIAAFFALVIVVICVKPFFLFLELTYNFEIFSTLIFWSSFFIIVSLSIIISGFYPSIVISSYKPTEVLKTKSFSTLGSGFLRKFLVGLQFLISALLMICTYIIIDQNNFLKQKDLGINIDDVVVVSKPKMTSKKEFVKTYANFCRELEKLPSVKMSSASFSIPSIGSWDLAVKVNSKSDTERLNHIVMGVDHNYIPLFDVNIIAGRNFRANSLTLKREAIISEKSMKLLGIESPEQAIGIDLKIETYDDSVFEVIGVTKDYHHESLNYEISTLILVPNTDKGLFRVPEYISLKMENEADVSSVENLYNNFFKGDIFEYSILKGYFLNNYKEEDRYQNVFSIFSFLAIFLATIGIIGLSSFIAFSREKEIAIRKVFGADVKDIFWILSKEFIIIFGVTALISVPATYYLMNDWLSNFPYKISISSFHFIISFLLIGLIVILIVLFNLFKSLKKSPIKSLKEE